VQHGIEYLLDTQQADGSWDEDLATGTGFPRVFYLHYHLYKDYFPLLALSSFLKARSDSNG
jgi:squalene-hopene/tetraprenyl-beta-curcumene cyclase